MIFSGQNMVRRREMQIRKKQMRSETCLCYYLGMRQSKGQKWQSKPGQQKLWELLQNWLSPKTLQTSSNDLWMEQFWARWICSEWCLQSLEGRHTQHLLCLTPEIARISFRPRKKGGTQVILKEQLAIFLCELFLADRQDDLKFHELCLLRFCLHLTAAWSQIVIAILKLHQDKQYLLVILTRFRFETSRLYTLDDKFANL